jgi:hypothetical protein
MNRPGSGPQPPQQKPFMIPGPYSSSGQFSPGTANILESIRLGKLQEQREAEERAWQDQQARIPHQPQHPQPGHDQFRQTGTQPAPAPDAPEKSRGLLMRLLVGLFKTAVALVLILVALAVIVDIFGG